MIPQTCTLANQPRLMLVQQTCQRGPPLTAYCVPQLWQIQWPIDSFMLVLYLLPKVTLASAGRLNRPAPISPGGRIALSCGIQATVCAIDPAIRSHCPGEVQRRLHLRAMDRKLQHMGSRKHTTEKTAAAERLADNKIPPHTLLLLDNPIQRH